MGFFFDDVEVSAVKKQKELPLNTLQTLGCKACPKFRKNPTNKILDPSGSKAPIIYFLGSHPFQEDFEFNEPFSSSFSDILFNNVPKALTEHLRYNNISNCLETQNEQDNNLSVICCNSRVKKDILDSDPVIIVALGSKVLNWLLPDAPSEFLTAGKEEIYKWRNRYFAVKIDNKVYWVYSLFDFEDLFLKAKYNKQGARLQSEHDITFEKDLQNLFTLLSNGTFDNPPVLIDSNYLENVQWTEGNKSDKELDKVFAWLLNLSSKENIAIDFETNCIKPQKENALLLTIAVGTFDESYAFPYEYPGAWTFTQLSKLKEFLIEFLQINQEKIAHNSKFEQNWILEKFNISYIKNKALFHDTQGQMYTLDERQGMHSLDIGIRLNFGFWLKALSNLDRSRMMDYPLDKILPYNGLDTKWTHRLWQIQDEKLKKDPILYNLYSKRLNKYVCLLTQVENTGFFIHKPTLERFRKAFTNDVLEAEQELLNLDVCQEYKRKFNKPLNPGSPPQLNTVLINLLDLKNDLVDKHGKVSTGEPLLFKIKDKVPFVDKLLKWRALNKKLTTYITPMFTHLMPDGAVHSNFNAYSTRTSRLCVAKGTLIETVRDFSKFPYGIPIENVQIGDFVYCYKNDLTIGIRKVLWSGKTGNKQPIRLHWESQNRCKKGYLDITANHPIRLSNGSYKRADELKIGDSVLSLFRSRTSSRAFLYQTGISHKISDQRLVYEEFFGEILPNHDIHHKDGNPLNNVPENLQMLSNADHASHHFKLYNSCKENIIKREKTKRNRIISGELILPSGEKHYAWLNFTRYQILKLIAKSSGQITKLPIDYGTFVKKCEFFEIDYKHCCMRYSKQGKYFGKAFLLNKVKKLGPTKLHKLIKIDYTKLTFLLKTFGYVSSKSLGIIPTKFQLLKALAKAKGRIGNLKSSNFSDSYKVKKYSEIFNIDLKLIKRRYDQFGIYTNSKRFNNHRITKIEYLDDFVEVYDLEVEETHNFIANELCISNSSSDPNLQNIPSRKGKEIREMFVPPKGYLIASADYGQIEARFLGVASQDKAFCEAIWNDYDVHMDWAKKIANAYPLIVNDELDNIKVLSTFRKAVKNQWTFPAFYGASYFSIARAMNIPLKIVEPLFEEFWEEFKGIKLWQQWVLNFYKEHNYVESMFGRRRHGPLSYNEIINTPIQSCLKAGSKIFTDKGIFNIEDLVNKSINVWTGFSYAKATGLCMGEHQLAKITLSSGIEINCDINHKLKNEKREWVNFQDLKIGQYVALTDTFSFDSLPEKQIDWFYFLGFYIGDGCFYKKDSNYPTLELVVGNSKYNDLEKLKDFLNDNLPEKTPKVFIYTDKTKKLHSLCIRGHDFAIFAKNILGLKYEINAHTKTIPEIVWKATKQQQFNFLQGLYDTDGARGKWQEWNLHLCNKTLLQQIQILQTALGIDSTLKQTNYGWLLVQRLGKNYTSRSYPFSTLEQDILDKKIKIKSSEKNESYELKKERIAERRAFLAKNITHSLARRIKNRYQLNEEFYRYDTITNIEILTNKELTYTLSVEDSLHQFVADGVITKNSASDTCLEAASEIAKKYYPDIMPAALIHDDITSYIREDIAEDLLDIIAKEMCTIPQMQEWINVPISAEIKVGYDWFNQVEFKTSKTTDFINLERRKQTFDTYQNYL